MKSMQSRSLLDIGVRQDDQGHVWFEQPDNDKDCETKHRMPVQRWEGLDRPIQVTITVETGDQLNGDEPVTDTGIVAQEVGSQFEWPRINGETEPQSLEEAVGLAGGAFSMCWPQVDGVFMDQRAVDIMRKLVDWVERRYIPKSPGYQVTGQSTWGSTGVSTWGE